MVLGAGLDRLLRFGLGQRDQARLMMRLLLFPLLFGQGWMVAHDADSGKVVDIAVATFDLDLDEAVPEVRNWLT
jgi:hypothetical protein